MTTNHILTIKTTTSGHDLDDMDLSIECPGVTDACAEWVECEVRDCPGRTGGEVADGYIAHGAQHRNIEGCWMTRSGFCFAENHGQGIAGELAERLSLGAGQYEVIPEFDDGTLNDYVLVSTSV